MQTIMDSKSKATSRNTENKNKIKIISMIEYETRYLNVEKTELKI